MPLPADSHRKNLSAPTTALLRHYVRKSQSSPLVAMNYLSSLFGYAQEPPKVQTLPMYRSALEFETKLLSLSKGRHPSSTLEVYDVELGDTKDNFIHTVEVSNVKAKSTGKDPVVIMHGYGNGIGYLFRNLLPLSASLPNRKIFGIDMLGFGLSSRPDFYESVSQPER